MLLPRILTVLVILPLFLAALFGLSQVAWGVMTLVIVGVGCFEWSKLIDLHASGRAAFALIVTGACLGFLSGHGEFVAGILLGVALIFWMAVVPPWLRGLGTPSRLTLAVAGMVVLCSAWYAVFDLQRSAPRLLALMCVVWIADTAAYFAGRRFGRSKLAPRISPGKTWEGVAGGVLGVGVYHVLLWWIWSPPFLAPTRVLDLAIVAGMTVLSVEGDLFESWLKRRVGVKDSGTILPGHGGVLDRIDGVVAALPFAALLSRLN